MRAQPARLITPTEPDPRRVAQLLAAREALGPAPSHALHERPFTLASLNCNGLRSAERRGFLAWLASARPDVLCLQEVRAWPEQIEPGLRCPDGYNTRYVSGGKKGYAGVATFSRLPPDRHAQGTGLSWSDEEGRALRSDFGEVSIVNLYAPSGSSSPDRQLLKFAYMDHLLERSAALLAEGRQLAICGDFNVAPTELDIHDPKSNAKNSGFLPAEREWFARLLEQGWVDVVRALHPGVQGPYSWWSNRGAARAKNLGWRIDHVLCSPALAARAVDARVDTKASLSDHAPVIVRFE